MKNLQLDKTTALKIFKKSSDEVKEILISTFGAECFSQKITDRIKTFEDACAEIGPFPSSIFNEFDTSDETAYKKLKIVIKALNEGWVPDWNDTNQKKWYPWFSLTSGFGFSGSLYFCTITCAGVGSRLCFKNEELATYAGTQFIDLYEQFLTLK